MNNRTLIIVASILLVGIATNWLIGVTEDDVVESAGPGNEPDVYVEGARITQFNEKGKMQHQLLASRMTHFPLTEVTTLAVPNMFLFQEQDEDQPWDIIATSGRLLPRSVFNDETVELWDQVLAIKSRRDGDFFHIETEALTVFPERDFAETDSPVSMDTNSGHTTAGGGMKAWFEEGRFEFYASNTQRVVSVLSPGALEESTQ